MPPAKKAAPAAKKSAAPAKAAPAKAAAAKGAAVATVTLKQLAAPNLPESHSTSRRSRPRRCSATSATLTTRHLKQGRQGPPGRPRHPLGFRVRQAGRTDGAQPRDRRGRSRSRPARRSPSAPAKRVERGRIGLPHKAVGTVTGRAASPGLLQPQHGKAQAWARGVRLSMRRNSSGLCALPPTGRPRRSLASRRRPVKQGSAQPPVNSPSVLNPVSAWPR